MITKPINPRLLIHRVDILEHEVAETPDAFGGKQLTERVVIASWPCNIQAGTQADASLIRENVVQATHKVFGNYPGVLPIAGQSLIFGSRTFEIVSVKNMLEANVWLTLEVIEISSL